MYAIGANRGVYGCRCYMRKYGHDEALGVLCLGFRLNQALRLNRALTCTASTLFADHLLLVTANHGVHAKLHHTITLSTTYAGIVSQVT